MKILDLKNGGTVDALPGKCVLALGNFDGVHVGHAELIKTALAEAEKNRLTPAVWTFEGESLSVLRGRDLRRLVSDGEKNSLFFSLGIRYAVYEDLERVKDLSPERFVKEILTDSLGCEVAVCGYNFSFGKGGAGDPALLVKLAEECGSRAVVLPQVSRNGAAVSSSGVRALIEEGRVDEAEILLGRPYSVVLPVKEGKKLGRTLGIPTLNQTFRRGYVRPGNGIYAAKAVIGGREYECVTNVGSRPTVNSDPTDVNCESHVMGFSGWVYGEDVKIVFLKKLRDEKKFDSLDELRRAVELDERNALAFFEAGRRADKTKE